MRPPPRPASHTACRAAPQSTPGPALSLWRRAPRNSSLPPLSATVFSPVRAEQFLFAGFVLGDHRDQVRDVEEVLVTQVLRNAVLLPRAAAHAEREAESGVEAAAVTESVGEIHQHPHHVEVFSQLAG